MAYTQTWKARFEAPTDIDWIAEPEATDWRGLGLELVDFDWSGLYDSPDQQPTLTMKLRAPSSRAMGLGLAGLVKHIGTYDDTHVLIESLKPENDFDGKRDGPFAVDEPDMSQRERSKLKRRLLR